MHRDLERSEMGSGGGGGAALTVKSVLEAPGIAPELKEFAVKHILPHGRTQAAELRERLLFLSEHVPVVMLTGAYAGRDYASKYKFHDFLRIRLPFLKALRERLTKNEWLELMTDSIRCNQFHKASYLGETIPRIKEQVFENFAQRQELPVLAAAGQEKKAAEVKDLLAVTGIEQIVKPFMQEMKMIAPVEGNRLHARYFHNQNGRVEAYASGTTAALLPGAILHEAGHGLQYRMALGKLGMELFDKYIVAAQLEEVTLSAYANSFKYSDGRASNQYVAEAFAEEFKIYWMMPEALSADKRAIFEEICDQFLPGVEREATRGRISKMLGHFYGKSVREAVTRMMKNPEETAKKMAKRRNRRQDESEKERLQRQAEREYY